MTLDQYIAASVVGKVLSSDLPVAATQALEEGYDSLDLAALAGSTATERSPPEMEEMWKRGLRQLAKLLPSSAEAGRTLRSYYAALVLTGSLGPRAGAAASVQLATRLSYVRP